MTQYCLTKRLPLDLCRIDDYGDVSIHPPPDEKGRVPLLFQLQVLMQMVPEVIVQGIPSIERAIVNKNKDRCQLHLTLVRPTDQQVNCRIGECDRYSAPRCPLIAAMIFELFWKDNLFTLVEPCRGITQPPLSSFAGEADCLSQWAKNCWNV